ncbi:hypothetical protein TKK_0014097 [Trichogramma kaykai]
MPQCSDERFCYSTSRLGQVPGPASGSSPNLEDTHLEQEEATGPKTQTDVLVTGQKLSLLENGILLYKSLLKPIWTYGIQLWGAASKTNIDIIERFQSKVIRSLVNAPWFVTNEAI